MKTNHRLIVKIITILLLIILVTVFTQCVPTNTQQIGNSSGHNSYNPGTLNDDKDEGQIINETQVAEGIKSHEQILHTMSALTGVPANNGNVLGVYNSVNTTLPTDNDIKVFLPPHQLAITKLAAEFCNELVNSTTLRAQVWKSYTGFLMTPNQGGLDMADRDLIIDEVILAFWGDIVTPQEKDLATDELHQLIDDLLEGENLGSSTTTRNVVKGVCTSVLSSAHVTLL